MKAISKIRQMFKIRRQRIFYLSDPNDIVVVDVKADISISEITFENVRCVTDFRSEGNMKIFRKYLEEAQYGVCAWLDSKMVGHAWAKVCRQPRCRVEGYMDICQNEALIHDCHVKIDQRGKNIFPSMLVALCQQLFSQAKVSRIIIDTETDNKPSLTGIAKVGFKSLGRGTYVQFRGHLLFKWFTNLPGNQAVKTKKAYLER